MTTGLRIEVLIAFAVAVGFFILVGLSTGLYNHIQRRRGRPGLFAYSPTIRNFQSNRRNQRPKGLREAEIEVLCPQLEYTGPDSEPVLAVTENKESNKESVEKIGHVAITIPSQVARTVQGSTSSAAPYSALSWETVKESIPHVCKGELEYFDGEKLPDTKEFFLGRHLIPDGVCAVCLDSVEPGAYLRLLPCGHAFHSGCITHWLSAANRCPLCNEPPLKRNMMNTAGSENDEESVNRRNPLFTADNNTNGLTVSNENEDINTLYQTPRQALDDIKLALARRYLQRQKNERESREVKPNEQAVS